MDNLVAIVLLLALTGIGHAHHTIFRLFYPRPTPLVKPVGQPSTIIWFIAYAVLLSWSVISLL